MVRCPFQLQSPSHENQLATIHKQVTIVKIPAPKNEAEAPLWNRQRLRRTPLEGWEEQLHPDCITTPPGGPSTAPTEGPWAYHFSSGKREPKISIQLIQNYKVLPGRPTQASHHRNHWGSDRDGGGGGARLTAAALRPWQTMFPLAVVPQQKTPTSSNANLQREELLALSGQRAWLALLPDLGPYSVSHTTTPLRQES